MGEHLFFSKLVTKNLTATDSNRRLFEGILTVEMKDRQGEITVRDELLKVLPIWIARGGPITDTHSNRVVGQGINFGSTTVTDSDGKVYPAISVQGEIFKDYELDNEIWNSIKSGKYKGLSFGGATKSNRTPIMQKDGSVAYSLKDLEQYEVAVCEEPAVPLALITQHNQIAKAMAGNSKDRGDGTMCIRCDKFKCYVDKDSLIKIEDDEDENTQVTVLDEWKHEKHPDKDGKTEGIRTTKNDVSKYEPLSDVTGENVPEGRDGQADGFRKKLSSEELEAERSHGSNQDSGATYHGTSKGIPKSRIGSTRFIRAEPGEENLPGVTGNRMDAIDESGDLGNSLGSDVNVVDKYPGFKDLDPKDEDSVAEMATIDEDKVHAMKASKVADSAEHGPISEVDVDQCPGTPIVKDEKTISAEEPLEDLTDGKLEEIEKDKPLKDYENPGGSKFTETNEQGDKTDKYGNKIPKILSKKPKKEGVKDKPGRYSTIVTPMGSVSDTTNLTQEQINARQARLENDRKKPKVGGKNIKWSPTITHDKETGLTTIDSTNKPARKPGGMGKITIPTERYINNFTKSLDILNILFKIKSDIIYNDPNRSRPNNKKTTNVNDIMNEAQVSGDGKKFLKNPNKEFKYASDIEHESRDGNLEDLGDKGAPSKTHPEKNAFREEQQAAHISGDNKVKHPVVTERGYHDELSADYARKLTSLNLDLLREDFLLKTQGLEKDALTNRWIETIPKTRQPQNDLDNSQKFGRQAMGARMTRKPRTRGISSRTANRYERLRDLSEIKYEKILDDKGQETSGSVTSTNYGGGTKNNPLADSNRKRQGGKRGKKEKATCYNTDEVVREYEDPKKKLKKQKELFKAFLNRNDKDRKYSFDEVQAILNDLTKDDKLHAHTGTSNNITGRHFVTSDGRITNELTTGHEETVTGLGHKGLNSYLHNTGTARVVHSNIGEKTDLNVHSHKPLSDAQSRTLRRHIHTNKPDSVSFDNYTNNVGENETHAHNSKQFPKASHTDMFNSEDFNGNDHGPDYKTAATGEDTVKKLKYPGLTPKQRKLQLEIDSEQREDPYDPDPPICKTNTDARTYTEPGRGGFAGREPGETCDYNESTSIHDVNQPKHVNRPTNADGAEGVKKESGNVYSGKPEGVKFDPKNPTHLKELGERWNDPQQGKLNEPRITARSGYCSQINVDRESHKNAGDPQLAANNAEDGIKDKFRLDNDPPAESFENKSETSPEYNKINPAGWCPGESIQKPGTFASTDEHRAMVLGDVPPSSVVGSQTHNNSEDGPHESEMNDKKYNHGLNQFQGEAQSHKSTNINDQGHGSGGVRAGASYDNSQQDTGAKDNPRVVIEEDYAGGEDTGNNSRNREDEDKEAAKEQETPKGLSKATIILDTLNLKLKL